MRHPPHESKNTQVFQLLEIWKEKSLELMRRHSHLEELQIQDYQPSFLIPSYWLSLIQLHTSSFKVTYKVFYSTEHTISFCKKIFKKDLTQIHPEHLSDFTKEFANLFIGKIRMDIDANNIESAVSLPMNMRGFDNLYLNKKSPNESYEIFWKFNLSDSFITNNIIFEIIDPSEFQNVNINTDSFEQEGMLELL